MLECPKGMVGRVIGKGGETIKALQKQFASNIQIDQSSDPMTITIAGQPHTVDSCAQVQCAILPTAMSVCAALGTFALSGMLSCSLGVQQARTVPLQQPDQENVYES